MHLHLPKPVHGWRAFAGEVGIIVIAILLALGAEQLVESLHWKHEATKGREAIDLELSHAAGVFEERRLVQLCLDKRLDEIDARLREARRTGRIDYIGEIGRPPSRPIENEAWATALSSGLLQHFTQGERNTLSILNAQITSYDNDLVEEQRAWATLQMIERSPGPISDGMLTEASATVARLQYQTWMNGLVAGQMLNQIKSIKVPVSYFSIFDREGTLSALETKVRERSVCQPLAALSPPSSP